MFKNFKARGIKDITKHNENNKLHKRPFYTDGDKMLLLKFAPIFCNFEKNMYSLAIAVFNQMGYETEKELSEVLNKDWYKNLSDLLRTDGGVHGFIYWGQMAEFMKKNLYLIDECWAEYRAESGVIACSSVDSEIQKHGLVQYICWTLQNWVLHHTIHIIELWEEHNDKKWQ